MMSAVRRDAGVISEVWEHDVVESGWVRKFRRFSILLCGAAAGGSGLAAQASTEPATISVASELTVISVEVLEEGLRAPSALAFLPDGRLLIAERADARLSITDLSGTPRQELAGLPPMSGGSGGGLLDVVPHPNYGENGWIYVSYSIPSGSGATLVLDRVRLSGVQLVDRERLFEATPALETDDHFGGRMVFDDGYLFLSSGDRQTRDSAQSLSTHSGKILRLLEDGTVPDDNPFMARAGALPEIWSYGHRNPQGLALHPRTGELWEHEHGPQGGDEINVIRPGLNYGWPRVTYGEEYGGGRIGEGKVRAPGMQEPVYYYRPSIAPSGMLFYSGRGIAEWEGNLLLGALALRHLNRLTVAADRVLHEERVLGGREWRVRSMTEGPDGSIYLGVDGGAVVRIAKDLAHTPP